MAEVKHFTMEDINALDEKKFVLVDFWATWCGPCRMMAPELDKVAEHYGEKLCVGKIDIDEHEQAAARYEVTSIPTMILFNHGEPVARIVGAVPAAKLIAAIDKAFVEARVVG